MKYALILFYVLFFLPSQVWSAGGVINGQPVNAAVTNAAFLFKNAADTDPYILTFSNATDSTSSTTGGLLVSGGLGIAKALFIGTSANSPAFISTSPLVAGSGIFRMASTDFLSWRNNANSGNFSLSKNTSDALVWNGNAFLSSSGVLMGNVVGTATTATNVATAGLGSGTFYPTGVSFSTSQSSVGLAVPSSAGISMNYSTNTVTATTFSGNATTATTATNIAGGAGGSVPYQSAAGTTVLLANGSAGQVLTSNGTTLAPTWGAASSGNLTGDVTSVGLATTAAATQANIVTLSKSTGVAVHGSNTNDSAAAGYVGERISSTASATNCPATGNYGDLTSISITAGDWEISAQIAFIDAGGVNSSTKGGVSITTGNASTGLVEGDNLLQTLPPNGTNGDTSITIAGYRVSLSGTTTHYLKYRCVYTGTATQASGRLTAVRVR